MVRNKKDATQDVLNLYNQMQEDENIESGKEEIKVTLEEIESAKKALYEAKEELGNAYHRLESTRIALVAAHRSTDNIVDGICHAIVKAEQSNLKVGINDEGLALWKSHSTLTLLATQDLPTFLYYMIDPLKSWCWGTILFYPFKNSRFS